MGYGFLYQSHSTGRSGKVSARGERGGSCTGACRLNPSYKPEKAIFLKNRARHRAGPFSIQPEREKGLWNLSAPDESRINSPAAGACQVNVKSRLISAGWEAASAFIDAPLIGSLPWGGFEVSPNEEPLLAGAPAGGMGLRRNCSLYPDREYSWPHNRESRWCVARHRGSIRQWKGEGILPQRKASKQE